MFMKNFWQADLEVLNIFEIDYLALKSEGINNLMFDLDDTILPNGNYFLDVKILNFFIELQKYFKVIIVTSAGVYTLPLFLKIFKRFYDKEMENSQTLAIDFRNKLTNFLSIDTIIHNVNKLNIMAYKRIIKEQNFDINQTAMIGNSLEMDILIPNILGLKTILVKKVPVEKKGM